MLFSYINVNFPDIVGNNTISETSVTTFLGMHLDKKLNFVNHITEMSMKVAKSIGFLYKLNRFLPETILKTLYTSLIHPYLSYGIEAWHGTYQNNTSKFFVLQKKAIRAINNLAYNEQCGTLPHVTSLPLTAFEPLRHLFQQLIFNSTNQPIILFNFIYSFS